jgi:regulator of cell morphogenesis and NO signaling
MADLVIENPSLLLLLEHFGMETALNDTSIAQLCKHFRVNMPVFLLLCNLYNGFFPQGKELNPDQFQMSDLIVFKKCHHFYTSRISPDSDYIAQLYKRQHPKDIRQLELFFREYFEEVLEHLRYEEEIVFPYCCQLLQGKIEEGLSAFSSAEYRDHHPDIETKLVDLKNFLLKHLSLEGDFILKRKMLNALIELENDLYIHSQAEELVLLPLLEHLELKGRNG